MQISSAVQSETARRPIARWASRPFLVGVLGLLTAWPGLADASHPAPPSEASATDATVSQVEPRRTDSPQPSDSGKPHPAGKTPIGRTVGSEAAHTRARTSSGWGSFGALCVVLGGLSIVCTGLRKRRLAPGHRRAGLQVLDSQKLTGQASVHLVQIGRRVIAVGSSPAGIQTLAIVDDPEEIAQLMHGECPETTAPCVEAGPDAEAPATQPAAFRAEHRRPLRSRFQQAARVLSRTWTA